MNLRDELIEVGAERLDKLADLGIGVGMRFAAEQTLDAMLDLLTERADKVKDHKGNIVAIQIDLAVLRNPGSRT